jgi:hypothetical protein
VLDILYIYIYSFLICIVGITVVGTSGVSVEILCFFFTPASRMTWIHPCSTGNSFFWRNCSKHEADHSLSLSPLLVLLSKDDSIYLFIYLWFFTVGLE